MSCSLLLLKKIVDFIITMILWIYFLVFGAVFFIPQYVIALFLSGKDEYAFQNINSRFLKIFFSLVKTIIPGVTIDIPENVRNIRSAIIVSNHLSYLDPILIVSIFNKHKTIVKGTFFKVPIFGFILKKAGFLPFSVGSHYDHTYITSINKINGFIDDGGVVFIFPEGTRSKDGKLQDFKKGAFSIAKRCNAPIEVLLIKNTDALFQRGKFLFNTCRNIQISVTHIGTIRPHYQDKSFSLKSLVKQISSLYDTHN